MEIKEKSIGKKIVVVGVSAVGKTTFARELAEKLNLPLTCMDALMWKPGWDYIGDDATRDLLDATSTEDNWVIEGYITKSARSFVFERADTIVYLDYGRFLSVARYIQRWWKHRIHPRPELPGSPEKFSFKFLRLVFTKGEAISLNKFLFQIENQSKIIILKSPNEAEHFLNSIKNI